MSNVYEVIDALRQRRHLSQRKLAELAGILPNTMTTLMTRRSPHIRKAYLESLASVFGMKWFELLNLTEEESTAFSQATRVPCALSEEAVSDVLKRDQHRFFFFFHMNNDETPETVVSPITRHISQDESPVLTKQAQNDDAQYKSTILLMLDRLNTDGLLEAMHQVLTLTRQAEFCKQTSNQKTKEDTEWQEKGQ